MIEPRTTYGNRVTFAAVILVAALAPFACVRSQTYGEFGPNHEHGHAKYHDFYQHWMMPHAPWVPCCNAKVTVGDETVGDCYPTEAELRPSERPELKGQSVWWAKRDNGVWIEVPENRYIREKNPDETGRDAHLCEEGGSVFCFRPPVGSL